MTNSIKARLLLDCRCELGEGVQWHAGFARLFWTDIHGQKFMACDENGENLKVLELPERLTSFAFDQHDRVLAAFESGLFAVDDWTQLPEQGVRLSTFEPDKPDTRYNDGRCDRQGRFIVGGMNEDGLKPISSLTRFDGATVSTLRQGIGCSNGICFSPDGDKFYFTDTPVGVIWVFDYDKARGEIANQRTFATADIGPGLPDGSCVDREGLVWNARFNGHCVLALATDGSIRTRIDLPVPQVTCACFGGQAMDRLFITTAREDMSDDDTERYPLSGSVFVADVGRQGLAEARCTDLR